MPIYQLKDLGWNTFFESYFEHFSQRGFQAGRIAVEHKNQYLLFSEQGELKGEVAGKLLYTANAEDLPKVGDWVVLTVFEEEQKAIIHEVLPRQTKISRKVAGEKTREQVIASNIDRVFIVQSLDQNFNLNRLERYLVMVYESGAQPVIILNKADLCNDLAGKEAEVAQVAIEVPILIISVTGNRGLDQIRKFLSPGETIAVVGSSGVGKSSLINALLSEEKQEVKSISTANTKGRHTTVHRELIFLKEGGVLVDTPGMRELQLWESEAGSQEMFSGIEALAGNCHYSNCSHTQEPGCAVLEALQQGKISSQHYRNYLKLEKEQAYLKSREGEQHKYQYRNKEKKLHQEYQRIQKYNRRLKDK
ncbi:ribosome small subunit-dependent GTPase A [Rapidithrix thailandica]|uniref:Small ribosomal subunit biogenesis GTPase RsgA n=1 Tax=Rapidithrix thailandica TaxID=413964 RepID=A0AAW9RV34_9BACT